MSLRFAKLRVASFGCVREASLELGPGLNVLYGPNDLGKSTLGRAIRAALLIPHGSSAASAFVPWDSDETPVVELTFETDPARIWRIEKRFGEGARGSSILRASRDGASFTIEEKARAVDGKVRQLLGWGIAPPGGKGGPKGLPSSFLGAVILGEQADVASIFRQTLAADTHDSGRERLTAALEAFAQDPTFKRILDAAQAKVGLAFTATGRPRRDQGSPFKQVAEAVTRAKGELERARGELDEYQQVKQRLEELVAERDRAAERHAEREERLARMREEREAARAREQVEALLADARAQLARRRAALEAVAAGERDLGALILELETAEAERARARAACEVAEAARNEAQAELDRLRSQDGDRERALAASKVEARRAELERELGELSRRSERAERALSGQRALAEAQRTLLEAEEIERGVRRASEEARARLESADRALSTCALVQRLLDVERLEAELRTDRAALDEAAADRALSSAKRAEVEALSASRVPALPSEAALEQLGALERSRALVSARLGGGISLSLVLERPLEVSAVIDGQARALHSSVAPGQPIELEAQRALELAIAGVGVVKVSGGEREARREAQALDERWRSEAEPLFAAHAAADLGALRALVQADRRTEGRIAELHREASSLEERAALREQGAAKLADREHELAALRRELEGKDVEAARGLAHEGQGAIEARRRRAEAERAAAREQLESSREREQRALLDARVQKERLETAARSLSELGGQADTDWQAELDRVLAQRASVVASIEEAGAELERSDAERAASLARAAQELERAAREVTAGRLGLRTIDERLVRRRSDRDQLEGRLGVQRVAAEAIDLAADERAVRAQEEALAALPAPAEAHDDASVAEAERALEEARRAVADNDAELRRAEGALQTVGGSVVQDREKQAREALIVTEKKEREVALEYEAYQLLVHTLRAAETAEGQHLGEALSRPVTEKLGRLTSGLYGKLEIAPTLEAKGVLSAGAVRELGSLSIGTQEQLATLLRLTVAEHLESALVLDDQLTQTDPERTGFFRSVLRRHAERAQIVVLTCRPLDYLDEGDLAAPGETSRDRAAGLVRAIDLSRVVTRSPSRRP